MSQNTARKKPRKNKKFRFQLLKEWIVANYSSCRVADIGGGKGLLAYLLYLEGWDVTVIDPERTLPLKKYKDLNTGRRIKLEAGHGQPVPGAGVEPPAFDDINWLESEFTVEMAKDYDLLVALHGHGVNMKIIEAAAKYQKRFILLPCCVIDEPIIKRPGVDWYQSLIKYAENLSLSARENKLNFKGRNRIIFN